MPSYTIVFIMLLRASLRFTCSLYTNKLMLNTLFFISSNEIFLCGFASRVGQSNAFKENVALRGEAPYRATAGSKCHPQGLFKKKGSLNKGPKIRAHQT